MATITGSVFYLQRIGLVPGSTIVVELRDDTDTLLGAWGRTTTGEQVPIDWSIDYPAAEAAGRALVAEARILVEGSPGWMGEAPVAVDENGDAVDVAIRLSPAPEPDDDPGEDELTAIEVTELQSLAEGWAE